MDIKTALKGTTCDTSPVHGITWRLQTQNADGSWTPGAWNRVTGKVQYRKNGIHVCGSDQIGYWKNHLQGREMTVWICEYDGNVSIGMHGFAARRVRLLRPWDGVEEV